MNVVTNRKTKQPYFLQGTVKNATNSAEGRPMALYQSVEDGTIYVRDVEEFKEKFSAEVPGTLNELLGRQVNPSLPLLPLIQGLVTRLDKLIAIFQLSTEPAPDCSAEDVRSLNCDIDDHVAFIEELALSGLFTPTVVKVQAPLFCSDPDAPVMYLIYNESRSLCEQMTADDSIKEYFGEGEFKIYAKARVWVDGTLQIVSRTEDMPW